MYGEVARKCSSTVRSLAELIRLVAMMLYWSINIAIVSDGWTSFVTTEARWPKPWRSARISSAVFVNHSGKPGASVRDHVGVDPGQREETPDSLRNVAHLAGQVNLGLNRAHRRPRPSRAGGSDRSSGPGGCWRWCSRSSPRWGGSGYWVPRPTTSTRGRSLPKPFTNCAIPTSSSSWYV